MLKFCMREVLTANSRKHDFLTCILIFAGTKGLLRYNLNEKELEGVFL